MCFCAYYTYRPNNTCIQVPLTVNGVFKKKTLVYHLSFYSYHQINSFMACVYLINRPILFDHNNSISDSFVNQKLISYNNHYSLLMTYKTFFIENRSTAHVQRCNSASCSFVQYIYIQAYIFGNVIKRTSLYSRYYTIYDFLRFYSRFQ